MIPLRSSERTYTTPVVTLILIAVNVAVFIYEVMLPGHLINRFIALYGLVPDRLRYSTLLTSMFIHGGFLHVAGNMWFLWIFGKGVEDILGHAKYLIFYLLCGVAAAIAQIAVNPYSPVPTVGASGAIAGVMGAYLVKFPRARINTLVPIIIFITTVELPAAFLLIYWFLIQIFSGWGSIGYSTVSQGDVAWFAHIGGFVAGIALVMLMPAQRRRYSAWS